MYGVKYTYIYYQHHIYINRQIQKNKLLCMSRLIDNIADLQFIVGFFITNLVNLINYYVQNGNEKYLFKMEE